MGTAHGYVRVVSVPDDEVDDLLKKKTSERVGASFTMETLAYAHTIFYSFQQHFFETDHAMMRIS